MAHWAEQYVGRPYVIGVFDCMDLVVLVQKEIFGKTIVLPAHAKSSCQRQEQIKEEKDFFVRLIESPLEGDLVLLKVRGRVQHVGIVCMVDGEKWVLHNAQGKPHGCVQFQRESDMCGTMRGYSVEGYYRWK